MKRIKTGEIYKLGKKKNVWKEHGNRRQFTSFLPPMLVLFPLTTFFSKSLVCQDLHIFILLPIFSLLYIYLSMETTLSEFSFLPSPFSKQHWHQQYHRICLPSLPCLNAMQGLLNLLLKMGPHEALTLFRKS